MKHVVGFSGGMSSAVLANHVRNTYGAEDTVLLFHDTKTEPPDNYRFRQDVATYLGMPMVERSDGRDIWQVFRDDGYLGNEMAAPCSVQLKQRQSLLFLREHPESILYLGFTSEEAGRAQKSYARYFGKGIEVRFPLLHLGITNKQCHETVTRCWGLRPPAMYEWSTHANCVPCIKGKKAYWGLVYLHEPEAWHKAAAAEEEFGHTIFREEGSLREELENCLRLARRWLRNKEMRQSVEALIDAPCDCSF